jgi:predicted flap endonuclease-1-like 5' DNA nuclease
MTMAKLEKVEGIGLKYAADLRRAGVRSSASLLEKGGKPQGRSQIAAASGIPDKLILEWVNHVDLFRVKGVGEEYADLLEEAGVDTVVELAQRVPENLYQAILEVNARKKLVRRPPALKMIQRWVAQAKKLPRKITY